MLKILKRITAGAAAISCLTAILPSAILASAAEPVKYEVENSVITSSPYKIIDDDSASNGKYVDFESDISCDFTFTAPKAGYYDISIVSKTNSGKKENIIEVNDIESGKFESYSGSFASYTIPSIKLNAGNNKISIVASSGWIQLDYITINESESVNKDYYSGVSAKLSNPNSSGATQRLMQYICDNYGEYIISGQESDNAYGSSHMKNIEKATGELPAIVGLDLINYSPASAVDHGSTGVAIEKAIEVYEAGGIVSFCWHWRMYDEYLLPEKTSGEPRWWESFYSKNIDFSKFDLEKIMNNTSGSEYKRLVSDIDAIAEQLKKLQEKDIPILFRPLHEGGGDYRYNNPWFWWGSAGGETYIKLWKLMYDRLTNYHGLNNLIWVWNGQSKDYYPGDEYVDIISEDIYNEEKSTDPNSTRFVRANTYTDTSKVVALSETGTLFDPDDAFEINAKWSWFMSWSDEYTYGGKYNDNEIWKTVYNHDKVITLSELPDLRTYEIANTTPATGVSLDITNKEVLLDDKFILTDTLAPLNSTELPVWTSSDNGVVKVDSAGTVTAVGIGTATVKCTLANGKSATCTVKVNPTKIEDLKVSSTTGSSVTLTWTAVDTADDYDVMILDANGKEMEVLSATSNVFEIKGLYGKTTYKFKVRAHRLYSGNDYYGEYSAAVTGTTTEGPSRIDTSTSDGNSSTPSINTSGNNSTGKADNSANTGSTALSAFGLTLAGAYVILANKKRK